MLAGLMAEGYIRTPVPGMARRNRQAQAGEDGVQSTITDERKDNRALYERDFHAWTEQQTACLENRDPVELDWSHVAEEIRDMGISQRKALQSRLTVLIIHLLKLRYSRAVEPRRKWRHECDNARQEIADELERSPSLKHHRDEALAKAWRDGRRRTTFQMEDHGENPDLPMDCPFMLEQIMDGNYYPEFRMPPGSGTPSK